MTSRPSRLTPQQRGVLIALTAAVVLTALVLGTVLALRSDSDSPIAETTTTTAIASPTTATSSPETTTTLPETTTTTEAETTTTVAETTTTTIEIRESFILRPDGIDRLFFGEDPDTVISELTERLGDPSSDTDWVDQERRYDGLCGGTEARFVTWEETLQVFFTDRETAWAAEGTRHFASYSVIAGVEDLVFETTRNVGLGSTVEEITDAYGDDAVFSEHPLYETEVFEIDPPGDGYLLGFMTGPDDDDIAIEIAGGFSCGE